VTTDLGGVPACLLPCLLLVACLLALAGGLALAAAAWLAGWRLLAGDTTDIGSAVMKSYGVRAGIGKQLNMALRALMWAGHPEVINFIAPCMHLWVALCAGKPASCQRVCHNICKRGAGANICAKPLPQSTQR